MEDLIPENRNPRDLHPGTEGNWGTFTEVALPLKTNEPV